MKATYLFRHSLLVMRSTLENPSARIRSAIKMNERKVGQC